VTYFNVVLGALFVIAGGAVLLLAPGALTLMGLIWVGVGIILVLVGLASVRRRRQVKRLQVTGKRADATITAIRDTGVTVNQQPRVELTLQVQPDDAPAFELKAKRLVSRVSLPQVGSTVSIKYDPEHPEDFAWDDEPRSLPATPAAFNLGGGDISDQLEAKGLDHDRAQKVEDALRSRGANFSVADAQIVDLRGGAGGGKQDPLDRLEKLSELKTKGVLTEAEFEAQKAKILAEP
jgi:hypothetical protein